MLHVYSHGAVKDNFKGAGQRVPDGWSSIEWNLDEVLTLKKKRPMQPGDKGSNIQLFIRGPKGSTFEVWETLVYVPRR
jgi:hypothetical protein